MHHAPCNRHHTPANTTRIRLLAPQLYFQNVAPGEELSVEYAFTPDALIPAPREFTIALTAFYADDAAGALYSSTFFNATVEIVEVPKLVDGQALFMWAILAAAVGAAGA